MDKYDFYKEEFVSLRAESQFHQVNASAVFALNVTALGIAVAAASKDSPIALPIVALLSSVLWVRYLDHLIAIFRVAGYINCKLRRRLLDSDDKFDSDGQVLGWEEYLRSSDEPDRGGLRAVVASWLRLSRVETTNQDPERLPAFGKDSRKGIYVATLAFSIPPPVLIALYVSNLQTIGSPEQLSMSIVLTVAGAIAWFFALRRTIVSIRFIAGVDDRIAAAIGAPRHRGRAEAGRPPDNEAGPDGRQ